MRFQSRVLIILFFMTLLYFFSVINATAKEKGSSISYHVIHEEEIDLSGIENIWSSPTEDKSSRLLYYKAPAPDLGERQTKYFSKETGERFSDKEIYFTPNSKAYVERETSDKPPYDVYKVYNLQRKLLSTVQFDKPVEPGWDGIYKTYIWPVELLGICDDGQYIGLDCDEGLLHVVIPFKKIYKKIPVFTLPVPLEGGHYYSLCYNPKSHDIFLSLRARTHYSVKERRDSYLCIMIDEEGNAVWRRYISGSVWAKMSPNGKYVVIFRQDKGKDFEGPVEIIDRNGNTKAVFYNKFSLCCDVFSEDEELFVLTNELKRVNIYEIESGKLINEFVFPGFHPVEEIRLNHANNLLIVLMNDPRAFPEGHRYLKIYDLHSSPRDVLWEYDMGYFNRKDPDYKTHTHLSVSHNGKEITAYSNGKLVILRMDEK